TSGPPWRRGSRPSTARRAGSAAAPTLPARAGTSPPRTCSTCSTAWASRPASTSTRSPRPPAPSLPGWVTLYPAATCRPAADPSRDRGVMRTSARSSGVLLLAAVTAGAAAPASRMELTVDSIMRGPRLVGYPPTALRWSGDSRELFFEWRRPGEDEDATYVGAREGGEPRRLTDEERKMAPAARGAWDEAHRRVLFVDDGDVVVVDSVGRVRRQVTRTAEKEASPRWARKESHVTFT